MIEPKRPPARHHPASRSKKSRSPRKTQAQSLRKSSFVELSDRNAAISGWRDQLRATEDELEAKGQAALDSDETPIDPQRMCRDVRDWLDTLESPIVIGFVTAVSSAFAYLTVIGTPACTIVYSSGYLKTTDFLKVGYRMLIVSTIILILAASFYWPLLGG